MFCYIVKDFISESLVTTAIIVFIDNPLEAIRELHAHDAIDFFVLVNRLREKPLQHFDFRVWKLNCVDFVQIFVAENINGNMFSCFKQFLYTIRLNCTFKQFTDTGIHLRATTLARHNNKELVLAEAKWSNPRAAT